MGRRKLITSEIIQRIEEKFPGKYDTSLVDYIDKKTNITLICKDCGYVWNVTTNNLFSNNQMCPECRKALQRENRQSYYQKEFIRKSAKIHNNKYDYSKVDYKDNNTEVIITCPEHGEFSQTPHSHLEGHGCRECQYEKVSSFMKEVKKEVNLKCKEEFSSKANKIHNNKYNYDKTDYINSRSDVTITCPIHGDFEQNAAQHLAGAGCPCCNNSRGENLVISILEENNINYETQVKIIPDNYDRYFKIDFQVILNNKIYFIEYNGKQHYVPIEYFGGVLQFESYQTIRDIKLREYCQNHNIQLLELPYYLNKNEIQERILEFLK